MSNISVTKHSQPTFKLDLKLSGFPLRLFAIALLGVGATALMLQHMPEPYTVFMVMLTVAIIIAAIYSLRSVLEGMSVGRGLALTWYVCILVPGILYILLPWVEIFFFSAVDLHPFHGNDPEHKVLRIYLWILGLFVIPIVLGLEQLVFAQSEVQVLEKEHQVSDLDFRIRPHFFFNSLNSVASLIAVDPVRAEEGLMDLADMFRVILTDKRKLVPFSAEYEVAYKYMTLEKMRLGERLQDEWQIGRIDETILLPILTLQPLIENAIYHGIETRMAGGKVSIKARQSNNNLYITIINPKPEVGKVVRKGNKIARKNLENRFRHLYKGRASLSYLETDNFYTVTIKVPRDFTIS